MILRAMTPEFFFLNNLLGRKVSDILSLEQQDAGEHSVEITLKEQPAGMYLLELRKEGRKKSIRMVLER